MKLFILFQGLRNTDKIWNNNKSHFLNQLKKRGTVFTYENKIYNTSYYNKENPEYNDYSPNIDFDLSYFNIKKHLHIVFEMILESIPNALEYEWIPVGFSVGACLALVFSNVYRKYCTLCILLDPIKNISPKNSKNIIQLFYKKVNNKTIKTNKELEKLKEIIMSEKNNQKEIEYLHYFFVYSVTKWIDKNRKKLQFTVPTYSFINIYDPDKYEEKYEYWHNDLVHNDIQYLKKYMKDEVKRSLKLNYGDMSKIIYMKDEVKRSLKLNYGDMSKIIYMNSNLDTGDKVKIICQGYYPIFLKNVGHFVFSGKKECKLIMDVIAKKTQ
jgi:hypothetical protein